MSGSTALDVRWPIGGLFTALGLLLAAYGLATMGTSAQYTRSLSVNINLWWGLTMLLFGLVVLLAAWRGRSLHGGMTGPSSEGLATEAREHRLGLEHER
jgi:membrane protein implicated in regulation of membrane protease activity